MTPLCRVLKQSDQPTLVIKYMGIHSSLLCHNFQQDSLENARALYKTAKAWLSTKRTQGQVHIDAQIATNAKQAEKILM